MIKCAATLAELGCEVFLFETGKIDSTVLRNHGVHNFEDSTVKGLRGTVGDFQVIVDMNGSEEIFQVGAVILGEQSRRRIPYYPTPDLPPRTIEASRQKRGEVGIPYYSPGATSIPGLFLANPTGIAVSERVKGAAAAILAASVMPRGPRQNKGYTVVVDNAKCRGCGRCFSVCPYQAVDFKKNDVGGRYAVVDEALCKGCGNCIAVCPADAADSPYRDRLFLEHMIEELLL